MEKPHEDNLLSIQEMNTLQKSRGSNRVSFAGMYFLYMLYSSWNEARDGKPPCIKSKTDTMPRKTDMKKNVTGTIGK